MASISLLCCLPEVCGAITIESCAQTDQAGDWYTFSGYVNGPFADGATVAFSGVLDGLNASADSEGYFSVSGYFPSGVVGYAYLTATDVEGSTSAPYSLYIEILGGTGEGEGEGGGSGSGEPGGENYVSPSIDYLSLDALGDGYYVISGHATGSAIVGASVTFSGELSWVSAVIDGDGAFSTIEYLPTAIIGVAYAEIVDWYGVGASLDLYVDICGDDDEPEEEPYVEPLITDFNQSDSLGDYYTFTGTISGSHVTGATVTFGGILDGLSTTADEFGNFSVIGYFPEGVIGIAYAQAVDTRGTSSNTASVYVDIPGSSE